jgi:hypothetical protein
MKTAGALQRAKAPTSLEQGKRRDTGKRTSAPSKGGEKEKPASSEKARNGQPARAQLRAQKRDGRADASEAKAYGMTLAAVGAGRSVGAEPLVSDVGAQLSQAANSAVHSLFGAVGAASDAAVEMIGAEDGGASLETRSAASRQGTSLEDAFIGAYFHNRKRIKKFLQEVGENPQKVDYFDVSSYFKNSNAHVLADSIYRKSEMVGQKRVTDFPFSFDEMKRAMNAKSRILRALAEEVNPDVKLENSVVNTGSGAGKKHKDDNWATVAGIINGQGFTRVQMPNGQWVDVAAGNVLMLGPGTLHQAYIYQDPLNNAYSSRRFSYADFLNVKDENGEWARFTSPA